VNQHCCNIPSVAGAYVSDHHVTLEGLLPCFISFIQKGLFLGCCIIAKDLPKECKVNFSPTVHNHAWHNVCGNILHKYSDILYPLVLLGRYWIYWVAVSRPNGFDKGISVV